MKRLLTLSAAVGLLMTSGALAQTGQPPLLGPSAPPAELNQPVDPAPQDPAASAPETEIAPAMPGKSSAAEAAPGERRLRGERRGERRDWRGNDNRGERHGRMHERMHERHHRGTMMRGDSAGGHHERGDRAGRRNGRDLQRGAYFRLSQGRGAPVIEIKCANRDTTKECVDAVLPMLEQFVPEMSDRD